MPKNNESFYETAWGTRAEAFFATAAAEGQGNLYRTLKIFERLDQGHVLAIHGRTGPDIPGQVRLTERSAAETRDYRSVFEATKLAVEHRVLRKTFTPLDYDALPVQWLGDIAGDGFDAIVELGAGYGRNLIELYCRGGPANARYVGAEFTTAGRALMEQFFALEPKAPFETAFFDHRKPDVAFFKGAKKVLLFTRHSIEQVVSLPADYFDVLAASALHVVAVHFEPFGPQCPPDWAFSQTHRDSLESQHYNQNFVETLLDAERRKRLKVRWLSPDVINPQSGNPTSIAVWDNRP